MTRTFSFALATVATIVMLSSLAARAQETTLPFGLGWTDTAETVIVKMGTEGMMLFDSASPGDFLNLFFEGRPKYFGEEGFQITLVLPLEGTLSRRYVDDNLSFHFFVGRDSLRSAVDLFFQFRDTMLKKYGPPVYDQRAGSAVLCLDSARFTTTDMDSAFYGCSTVDYPSDGKDYLIDWERVEGEYVYEQTLMVSLGNTVSIILRRRPTR